MQVSVRPKKFLCIDDDRTVLLVIKKILSKAFGEQVVEYHQATSGEEGLEMIDQINPDIIFCDIQMPGIDGFEVCGKIRAQQSHAAIILMSAYDAEEDNATKASESGADAFLSKPVKKGELIFAVNFVLRVAQLNDTVQEKNKQLEKSLVQLKEFHQKLSVLNQELIADKRRLGNNLKDMTELNEQMGSKNSQISAMVEELAGRFDSTVGVLVNIIEMRQAGHRGHSERVAEISTFIAEKVGLSDVQMSNIKTAALLHELGIVSLPEESQKEQAVSGDERGKVLNHPLIGEMLLKGFPGFELIADMIRHLHENVDGSGIPDGLYGDRIPIGSRIICLSSFFDHAKLANRSKSASEIVEEMEEKIGVIFDEMIFSHLREYVETGDEGLEDATIECAVFGLTEGMELATDIYSESGINLLRKGTVIDKEILSKIIRFHNVDPIAGSIRVKQT